MDEAASVQIHDDGGHDRQDEQAYAAEQPGPRVHAGERDDGPESHPLADDPGLDDLPHHGDDQIQRQQPQSPADPAGDQGDGGPRDQNGAAPHDGERVADADEDTDKQRVLYPDDPQSDGVLRGGDEKDQEIGPEELPDHVQEGVLHVHRHPQGLFLQIAAEELADPVKVHGDEHRGDQGDERIQKDAGEPGGQRGKPAHQAGREAGHGAADGADEIGQRGLHRAHHGFVHPGGEDQDPLIQPVEAGHHAVFVKVGSRRRQMHYRVRHTGHHQDDQPRQDQIQHHYAEHPGQGLVHVEFPPDQHPLALLVLHIPGLPAEQPGQRPDHSGQDEGHGNGRDDPQQIAEDKIDDQQDRGPIGQIEKERYFGIGLPARLHGLTSLQEKYSTLCPFVKEWSASF